VAAHLSVRPDHLHLQSDLVGTSFKPAHLPAIISEARFNGFFEVHAENYMGRGGPPHRALETIREHHPISVHGVCMSVGGQAPLDLDHLSRFREVVARYEPMLVSEHLAWSSHAGTFFNDLLPLPYSKTTLDRTCNHIDQIQTAIGRSILIENPSTYVAFASSTMTELDFLHEIAQRTGCGLLLDINNAYVSAINHHRSAKAYLADFPLDSVREIHLAGHSEQRDEEGSILLIDSHDGPVSDPVWRLYRHVIERMGPTPTLIEWDGNVPAWPVLQAQAEAARRVVGESSLSPAKEEKHEV
jgi:hypothetical protein